MALKDLVPSLWGNKNIPIRREGEQPFFALQNEMNRIFDNFFNDVDLFTGTGPAARMSGFSPTVDILDNEKELTVKAELPGMEEKEIEVSLADDALTIQGEKKEEKEQKDKGYYQLERSFGSFRRVLPLPAGVDTQKAEASFKKGVLTITIPKVEEAKSRVKKIAIKAE